MKVYRAEATAKRVGEKHLNKRALLGSIAERYHLSDDEYAMLERGETVAVHFPEFGYGSIRIVVEEE